MSRKTKRTYQKQKQQQVQKVVVNVGERIVKKRKVAKKRRHRGVSQEAEEYAQAISQIIPRIQYTFPSHTNFGYEPAPNIIMQQTRPNDVTHTIPIMAPKTLNERENLLQEKDHGFPKSEFTEKKPEPNELPLPKPEPSSPYREIPIDHPDNIPPITEGLTQIQHEKKVLAKQSKIRKPDKRAIDKMLDSRGLPNTPENREKMETEYLHERAHLSASELRKKRAKEEKEDIELERKGMISRLKNRPPREEIEKKEMYREDIMSTKLGSSMFNFKKPEPSRVRATSPNPFMREEKKPSIPLNAPEKKVYTLADIREIEEKKEKATTRKEKSRREKPNLVLVEELE
jgi:hypothetical protein